MNDQELKDQINEIKADIREIRNLVTTLRINQEGLRIKSSLFGLLGGALACVPAALALLFRG